ncbi:hypothetical protein FPV67DRAFT_1664696 [Lyophyllum atratum]|nr:hypothetical protein FPV67DRAFT_1664696 [Lyophyllum atratum]
MAGVSQLVRTGQDRSEPITCRMVRIHKQVDFLPPPPAPPPPLRPWRRPFHIADQLPTPQCRASPLGYPGNNDKTKERRSEGWQGRQPGQTPAGGEPRAPRSHSTPPALLKAPVDRHVTRRCPAQPTTATSATTSPAVTRPCLAQPTTTMHDCHVTQQRTTTTTSSNDPRRRMSPRHHSPRPPLLAHKPTTSPDPATSPNPCHLP